MQIREKETQKNLRELEKLYETKIDMVTDKLLTSEEVNYRDKILSENRMKFLEQKLDSDVDQVRKKYLDESEKQAFDREKFVNDLCEMKKKY